MTTKETSEAANLSVNAHALLREDSTPEAFAAELEKQGFYEDAVSFWAHKLPAIGAAKWALACIRELESPEQKARKNPSLEAADRWALAPGDAARWAAKDAADKAAETSAAEVLAMGIFLSGGSVAPPGAPEIQPPPFAGQKLMAGSVRITIFSYDAQNATARYQRALALARTQ